MSDIVLGLILCMVFWVVPVSILSIVLDELRYKKQRKRLSVLEKKVADYEKKLG